MARDFLKDDRYFDAFIKDEDAAIRRYEQAMAMVIEQRGVDDPGVQAGYTILTNYHFTKLNALYSGGRPLEEIRDALPRVIELMEKSWSGEDYEQMLTALSIVVMIGHDEWMQRLADLIRKHGLRDCLIEFLINGKPKGPLLFAVPYAKLMEVIQSGRHEQAEKLKSYLEKDWYDGHSDSGWYETHKHPDPIYNGYWSFESGAVAKILGLDDSSLKDVPYYPYEVVHYME